MLNWVNNAGKISLTELSMVSKQIIAELETCKIVVFRGGVGAGKTTLIKNLCIGLGVQDLVSSPTFSLINEYITNENQLIYHFDFYRLNNLNEALNLGVEEYLFSGNVCLIEWPELIEELLPQHISVNIANNNSADREYIIDKNG